MDQSEECDIVWKDISRAFTIDDERIKESIRHSNIGMHFRQRDLGKKVKAPFQINVSFRIEINLS